MLAKYALIMVVFDRETALKSQCGAAGYGLMPFAVRGVTLNHISAG